MCSEKLKDDSHINPYKKSSYKYKSVLNYDIIFGIRVAKVVSLLNLNCRKFISSFTAKVQNYRISISKYRITKIDFTIVTWMHFSKFSKGTFLKYYF